MKTLIRASLTSIAVLAMAMAHDTTVAILPDVSRSVAAQTSQMKTELKQLALAAPDGTRCVVYLVGGTVRRVFDGSLDAAHRAELLRQVEEVRSTASNTDLGGALIEGIRAVAASPGRRQVWIFTDGVNQPLPGSVQRNRSFRSILEEITVPPGVELHIRIYGNGLSNFTKPGVTIHRDIPDFTALLKPPPTPVNPAPQQPEKSYWKLGAWSVGIVGIILILCIAVRKRRPEDNDADLTAPVEMPIAQATSDVPELKTSFTIEVADSQESRSLDETGEAILVGNSPAADIVLPDARGVIRLRVESIGRRKVLVVQNNGPETIHIGRKAIAPGRFQELPPRWIELRVGAHVVRTYPEVAVSVGGGDTL